MVQWWSPRKWHGTPGFISCPSITPTTQPSQHAVHSPHARGATLATGITAPQHFLYSRPLPHGHGSLRPTGMGNGSNRGVRPVYSGHYLELRSSPQNRLANGLSRRPAVPPAGRELPRREDVVFALRAVSRRGLVRSRPPGRDLPRVPPHPRGLRGKVLRSR